MSLDPAQVTAALDADAAAVSAAAAELSTITDQLVAAEIAYQDEMDLALVAVEEEYRARDEKLPSERQREAHARPKVDPAVRQRYLELSTRAKQIAKWGELRARSMSARQSELSFLKSEGMAPAGAGQPQWGRGRAA